MHRLYWNCSIVDAGDIVASSSRKRQQDPSPIVVKLKLPAEFIEA